MIASSHWSNRTGSDSPATAASVGLGRSLQGSPPHRRLGARGHRFAPVSRPSFLHLKRRGRGPVVLPRTSDREGQHRCQFGALTGWHSLPSRHRRPGSSLSLPPSLRPSYPPCLPLLPSLSIRATVPEWIGRPILGSTTESRAGRFCLDRPIPATSRSRYLPDRGHFPHQTGKAISPTRAGAVRSPSSRQWDAPAEDSAPWIPSPTASCEGSPNRDTRPFRVEHSLPGFRLAFLATGQSISVPDVLLSGGGGRTRGCHWDRA